MRAREALLIAAALWTFGFRLALLGSKDLCRGTMAEQQLKDALEALKVSIDQGDAPRISQSLETIERVYSENRSSLHPELKHYMMKRSYMKALMFLNQESDIPKGRCKGRTDFS
jgi:hypothetical protein